jgi:2-methylcitrate dehydratase PrpD
MTDTKKPYRVCYIDSAVVDVVFAFDRRDAKAQADRLAVVLDDTALDCVRTYPKRWDAATREALKASIKKWDGIVKGERRDMGTIDCALCKVFYYPTQPGDHICDGCPVASFSGRAGCKQTSYGHFSVCSEQGYAVSHGAEYHANRMLNLLKGLLAPEPAKKKKKKKKKKEASA